MPALNLVSDGPRPTSTNPFGDALGKTLEAKLAVDEANRRAALVSSQLQNAAVARDEIRYNLEQEKAAQPLRMALLAAQADQASSAANVSKALEGYTIAAGTAQLGYQGALARSQQEMLPTKQALEIMSAEDQKQKMLDAAWLRAVERMDTKELMKNPARAMAALMEVGQRKALAATQLKAANVQIEFNEKQIDKIRGEIESDVKLAKIRNDALAAFTDPNRALIYASLVQTDPQSAEHYFTLYGKPSAVAGKESTMQDQVRLFASQTVTSNNAPVLPEVQALEDSAKTDAIDNMHEVESTFLGKTKSVAAAGLSGLFGGYSEASQNAELDKRNKTTVKLKSADEIKATLEPVAGMLVDQLISQHGINSPTEQQRFVTLYDMYERNDPGFTQYATRNKSDRLVQIIKRVDALKNKQVEAAKGQIFQPPIGGK